VITLLRERFGRFLAVLLLAFLAGIALTVTFPEFRACLQHPIAAASTPRAGPAVEARFAPAAAQARAMRTVLPEPAPAAAATASSQTLRLPLGALLSSEAGWFVFVETAPGSYALREVDVAALDGDFAYATYGVAPHERVVASAHLMLPKEVAVRP
jgi:hypothetical protein